MKRVYSLLNLDKITKLSQRMDLGSLNNKETIVFQFVELVMRSLYFVVVFAKNE